MKKASIYITIVVCFICIILGNAFIVKSADNQNDGFKISYSLDDNLGYITKMDATDKLLLLVSDNFHIYAYDFSGAFRFCIYFPYHQNGLTQMRCFNNLIYIKSVEDTIYIFDEDQMINIIQNNTIEYTSLEQRLDWDKSNILKENFNTYLVKSGEKKIKIIMPASFYKKQAEQFIFTLIFILFIPICFLIRKKHKKLQDRLTIKT